MEDTAMLKEMKGSEGPIVGMQATGKVTDDDYKTILIPRLEAVIAEHGKARFLFDFSEGFDGYEPKALWDDAAFGVKHRNDFDKCAIVGGPKWIEWGTKLAQVIMNGEVKTFPQKGIDDAWIWIKS